MCIRDRRGRAGPRGFRVWSAWSWPCRVAPIGSELRPRASSARTGAGRPGMRDARLGRALECHRGASFRAAAILFRAEQHLRRRGYLSLSCLTPRRFPTIVESPPSRRNRPGRCVAAVAGATGTALRWAPCCGNRGCRNRRKGPTPRGTAGSTRPCSGRGILPDSAIQRDRHRQVRPLAYNRPTIHLPPAAAVGVGAPAMPVPRVAAGGRRPGRQTWAMMRCRV